MLLVELFLLFLFHPETNNFSATDTNIQDILSVEANSSAFVYGTVISIFLFYPESNINFSAPNINIHPIAIPSVDTKSNADSSGRIIPFF